MSINKTVQIASFLTSPIDLLRGIENQFIRNPSISTAAKVAAVAISAILLVASFSITYFIGKALVSRVQVQAPQSARQPIANTPSAINPNHLTQERLAELTRLKTSALTKLNEIAQSYPSFKLWVDNYLNPRLASVETNSDMTKWQKVVETLKWIVDNSDAALKTALNQLEINAFLAIINTSKEPAHTQTGVQASAPTQVKQEILTEEKLAELTQLRKQALEKLQEIARGDRSFLERLSNLNSMTYKGLDTNRTPTFWKNYQRSLNALIEDEARSFISRCRKPEIDAFLSAAF